METGCWISFALLLCHTTFTFCYLTSKAPSPWNLTLLFCCLLTRYTRILHPKSACPYLPCFAEYLNPNQVQDQRSSSNLYLHNKKVYSLMHIFILYLFTPSCFFKEKKKEKRKEERKKVSKKERK